MTLDRYGPVLEPLAFVVVAEALLYLALLLGYKILIFVMCFPGLHCPVNVGL